MWTHHENTWCNLVSNVTCLVTKHFNNIFCSWCRIKSSPVEEEFDFTDSSYQEQLPAHARSTASMAIKNNIASTELSTDPDRILCRQKVRNVSECPLRGKLKKMTAMLVYLQYLPNVSGFEFFKASIKTFENGESDEIVRCTKGTLMS